MCGSSSVKDRKTSAVAVAVSEEWKQACGAAAVAEEGKRACGAAAASKKGKRACGAGAMSKKGTTRGRNCIRNKFPKKIFPAQSTGKRAHSWQCHSERSCEGAADDAIAIQGGVTLHRAAFEKHAWACINQKLKTLDEPKGVPGWTCRHARCSNMCATRPTSQVRH